VKHGGGDLPVLDAVVSRIDGLLRTNGYPEAVDIADCIGMQILDVVAALNAWTATTSLFTEAWSHPDGMSPA
jgi:hypothetical protein